MATVLRSSVVHQSTPFSLPSTTLLVEVHVAPPLAEIHETYAPLLRLAGVSVGDPKSSTTAPRSPAPHSTSGEEEGRGRRTPAMSPVGVAETKLAELTAPVHVTLPPPLSNEDTAFLKHYVESFRANEVVEKAYIAFVFQEYKKRKSMEHKWQTAMETLRRELEVLRQRELPPEAREVAAALVEAESAARQSVHAAYDKFLAWIDATMPQWIDAARQQTEEREANARAKTAAMAAAREAIAQELAMGRQLEDARTPFNEDLTRATVQKDGTLSYEPSLAVQDRLGAAAADAGTAPRPSELRRKAIRMLEAEEEGMRRRREEQVHLLKVQEEQLRAEMDAKRQHAQEAATQEATAKQQQHEEELAKRYNALLEQEFTLQNRARERAEQETRAAQQRAAAEAQVTEERRMLMEHVAAEEELLRRRLREKEDRQKASEEEATRVARERKMAEVKTQEEALRRRLAERQAAAEAEQRVQAEAQRRSTEAEAVRAMQAEALRVAHERQAQEERARQLELLREQEAAYKRHLREKEITEIEAKRRAAESQWTHSSLLPPSPYVVSSSRGSSYSAADPSAMPAMVPQAYYNYAPPSPYVPAPAPPTIAYVTPYGGMQAPQSTMAMPGGYAPCPGVPYYAPPHQPPPQPGMMPLQPSPYAPSAPVYYH